jgi:hypothetical protein
MHYTTSRNVEGTIAWFQDPRAQVSAHFIIGRDGEIYQMVRDSDRRMDMHLSFVLTLPRARGWPRLAGSYNCLWAKGPVFATSRRFPTDAC